ncbi:MAG: hypothetical protein ACR2KT_17030 [Methylocella sp.]
MPPLGAELQYRIKSEGEAHERVASEHELQVELKKPIVAAGSRLPPLNVGHLEKYPFRAASKSDSKNLFEFDQWERCDGAIGFL